VVAVAEYAVAAEALADLSVLHGRGIAALLLPDAAAADRTDPPFRLLVPEESGLAALQLLAREASAADPRVEACPRCGLDGLRVPPGRRLLGLLELALRSDVAPVVRTCRHCGWDPARDDPPPRA
jgi:hypothetical protein